MDGRRQKMLSLGGFVAAATVLASASAAFACVQVIGRLEVTGTNGGTSVSIGNGTHPPRNPFCVPPTNGATAPRATSFANRPTVHISYGPASECNPIPDLGETSVRPGRANTPGDGTYEVNFSSGKVFQLKGGVWEFKVNPIDAGSPFFNDAIGDRGVIMGTMVVVGGSGSASLRIPTGAAKNGPSNTAGVAVRRTGPGPNPAGGPSDVNIAAITIL